jgi:hypothetical protein
MTPERLEECRNIRHMISDEILVPYMILSARFIEAMMYIDELEIQLSKFHQPRKQAVRPEIDWEAIEAEENT